MSSSRGLRVMKVIETYHNKLSNNYDTSTILSKVTISSLSDGCAKGSFIVDTSMCNAAGTLHGGYIASVVDTLSFFSLLSAPREKVCVTTNMNVEYIKMAPIGEKVSIETKLLNHGNTPVLETYLYDGSGAKLAKGTASFQAASERLQKVFKDLVYFDANEN